MYENMYIEAEK